MTTKKDIKAATFTILWGRLYYGAPGDRHHETSLDYEGYRIVASRTFHRGRTGPAWTPSYTIYRDGKYVADFTSAPPAIDWLQRQLTATAN